MADTTRKFDVLSEILKRDILAGRFGQRMPGERVLSRQYSANFKTISRALHCLEEEGLLKTVRGEGRLIVGRQRASQPRTVVLLIRTEGHLHENFAMDLVRRLQAAGLHALPIDAQQFQGTSAEVSRILAHRPVALVAQDTNDQVRGFYVKHQGRFPRKIVWSGKSTREYSDALVVRTDYRQGVHLATRHLVEQGHRRIVFLHYLWAYGQETHPGSAHEQAMQGYEEALAEAGLAGNQRYLFFAGNQSEVLRQIRALFREPADTRPDGLITYMDFWAAKAIHEIRRLGLRVPQDVAVVGHNNTPWTEWAEVPLSSVDIQQAEIARIIVENLTGHYHPGEVMTVQSKLVVRASSASDDSPHPGPEHEVSTMEVAM